RSTTSRKPSSKGGTASSGRAGESGGVMAPPSCHGRAFDGSAENARQMPASALLRTARLAEQEALAVVDRQIEKLQHNRLGLDPLDDQVDAVAVERALERSHVEALGLRARMLQKFRGIELDEPEMAGTQRVEIEIEMRDLVHREAEAEARQALELEHHRGSVAFDMRLRELEDQARCEVPVAGEEGDELAEEIGVGERVL